MKDSLLEFSLLTKNIKKIAGIMAFTMAVSLFIYPLNASAISNGKELFVPPLFWEEMLLDEGFELALAPIFQIGREAENLISSGGVNVQTQHENLDFTNKNVSLDEMGSLNVVVPIVNYDYNLLSALILVFDENVNLKSYMENHIRTSDMGYFEVSTFLNGILINHTLSDIEYISNNEFQELIDYFDELANEYGMYNISVGKWCLLAVAGVGAAFAALILIVCSTMCIISRAACGTCATSLGTVGGATVAGIAACFGVFRR
ncbi:MAG: hypothetical protein FWF59_00105 [Turicibacter sp.]|nr:hypothetical protein [Turicibacter sp.]